MAQLEEGASRGFLRDCKIFANLRLNFEALFHMQHVGAGGQVFPITGTSACNFPDAIIAPETGVQYRPIIIFFLSSASGGS